MIRNVRLLGWDELQKNLDADILVQPELDDAMETFGKRIDRQGKGLGAQRNELTRQTQPLTMRTTSTLNHPRTAGSAWTRKNEGILKGMGTRVMKKAVQRIEERWAQGGT